MDNITNDDDTAQYHNNFNLDASIKPMKTGAYLQSVRIQKNLTEDDIYKSLKIKARIIKAIESQHYTSLPDTVTVAALVRQYSQFLGLDAIQMSTAYKNEMNGTDQKIEVIFPDKLPSSFRPFKNSIFITCALLGIYFVWHFLNNVNNIIPEVTPAFDKVANTSDSSEVESVDSAPETTSEDAVSTVTQEITPVVDFKIVRTPEFALQATGGDSWIEVKDSKNNRVIYSAILKNGDSYKIPSDLTGLLLKAGNSVPLSITVNGESLDILPKTNRVLRNFNIDTKNLLGYYTKQKTKIDNQTQTQNQTH